jgi:hypothetical protein
MTFMSREEIRKAFQESASNVTGDADLSQTLALLSRALRELRDAGIDVAMTVHPYSSAIAFSFSQDRPISVPLGGIINIDNTDFYFAIITSKNDQPCQHVVLSHYDIRLETGRDKIGHTTYDFSAPEEINEFQETIIDRAARLHAIEDIDAKNGNMLTRRKLRKNPLEGDSP